MMWKQNFRKASVILYLKTKEEVLFSVLLPIIFAVIKTCRFYENAYNGKSMY